MRAVVMWQCAFNGYAKKRKLDEILSQTLPLAMGCCNRWSRCTTNIIRERMSQ
jgi:hypothetical protein